MSVSPARTNPLGHRISADVATRRWIFPIVLGFAGIVVAIALLGAHASATIVVVGDQGSIITSPTGTSWTPQTSGTSSSLRGIANDGSLMVAVGDAGTILSSSDGVVWTSQTSGTTQNLRDVAFSGGVWVAVGDSGTVVRSTNSVAWILEPTPPGTNTFQDVATDGTQWVAVGNVHTIETSPDGVTWTNRPNAAPGHLDAVANYAGKWLATGDSETVLTSSNAVTWTKQTLSPGTSGDYLWGVTHSGSQWVIVDASHNVYTSPDAVTWTLHATGATTQLFTVRQDSGQYVAVGGTTGSNALITSPDAVTWTSQTPGTAFALEDIAFPPPASPIQCSPASQTVLVGVTASLTASGGTPPYSWTAPSSSNPGPVSGATFATTYGVAGTYAVTLKDTGNVLSPQQTTTCTVIVNNPPPLTCTPSPSTMLVGATTTITATNGVAPYTWTASGPTSNPGPWTGNPYTTSWSVAGSYTVTVKDSWSPQQTGTCIVTVNNPPPPTCSPTPVTILVGASKTFTGASGVAPYTWAATGSPTTSVSGNTFTASWGAAGSYTVTVHDSGPPIQSATCTVTVKNPTPPTCTATSPILTGDTATITVANGVPPYTWSTTGSGSPPSGAGPGPTFTSQYVTPGTKTITVSDSGPPVQSGTCSVVVNDPPALSCSPSSQNVLVGASAILNAGGGTPAYSWSATGGSTTSGSGTTFSTTYATGGPQPVTLTDNGFYPQSASCTVNVSCGSSEAPVARFSASASSVYVGYSVTFVDASTTTKPCDWVANWDWTFDDGYMAHQSKPIHVFGNVGAPMVCLVAVNEANQESKPSCMTIHVMPPPPGQPAGSGPSNPSGSANNPVNPPPTTNNPYLVDAGLDQVVKEGKTVTLHGSASGTSPTFHWTQLAGPAAILSGAESNSPTFVAPHPAGSVAVLYFELDAQDGSKSGADGVMVTVQSAQVGPTARVAADSTAKVGATVTLDASASTDDNGDALTYLWTQWDGPAVAITDSLSAKATFTTNEPGTYTFAVAVSDGQASSIGVQTIIVQAPAPNGVTGTDPTMGFTMFMALDGKLTVTPTIAATSYSWNFGDGTPAMNSIGGGTHAFSVSGNYTITMTATGPSAASRSYQASTTIHLPESYSVGTLASHGSNDMMWLAIGVVGLFGLLAAGVGYLAAKRSQTRAMARRSAVDGEVGSHGLDA